MKQIIISIITMTLVVINCSAQSLNELINTALQNNYQIRIMKNEALIASNNNTIGNSGQLPSIDVKGTYSTSYNNTLQKFSDGSTREGKNANNVSVNLSTLVNWTVFDGFRVYAKKDQLTYLEEFGQQNCKFYIEQTISDIITAYYQLIYEKQLLKNFQQSLNISAFRLSVETKRKEIGLGTIMDYGQAQADYQSDSIHLLTQKYVVQSLEIEINRILNNDLEKPLVIDTIEFKNNPLPLKDTLFGRVELNNSQLEQQRLLELISETELRMQKANRYPKIDLFAGYQYTKSFAEVGFVNSNQNFGPTVGISVNFNLFNGGNTNRIIKNTEIYNQNSQLTKQQVNQSLNANVLNLYKQYISVNERITLAKSNIETITKVYNVAEQQLKKGAINGYDFRLTQLTLLNSELTLIQLQFSLQTIEINLNRLSGTILQSYL